MRFQAQIPEVLKAFALTALVLFALPVRAASMAAEIDHLIGFIAASPCTFIRNGVAYDGQHAIGHIKDKYEYYRDDIRSAEDFIARAASKSELTGKPYLVQCDAATEAAADWLARELGAFRRRSGS